MEREYTPDDAKIEARRRCLKAAAGFTLFHECARQALRELVTYRPSVEDRPQPRSLRELSYVVQRELQRPLLVPAEPAAKEIVGPGSLGDFPGMIQNGYRNAAETNAADVKNFFSAYGTEQPDPEHVRCNNYAYNACRSFERYGMPMHLLAIAPRLKHFLAEDWHVMAFCPLKARDDGSAAHLLFDNGSPILWKHGGLASFVSWYDESVPSDRRHWIPPRGVARFREPRHTIAHRILMHVSYPVTEAGMERLELDALSPRESSALA